MLSGALGEGMDINNLTFLETVARFCKSIAVQEEPCCVKPIYVTTKSEDVAKTFVESVGVEIRRISTIATDLQE